MKLTDKEIYNNNKLVLKSIDTAKEVVDVMRDIDLETNIEKYPNLHECLTHNSEASKLIENLSISSNYLIDDTDKDIQLNKLLLQLNKKKYDERMKLVKRKYIISSLAAVFIALSFLLFPIENEKPKLVKFTNETSTIKKPVITLSSGECIPISTKLPIQIKNIIAEDSKIEQNNHSNLNNIEKEVVEYNTITVPHNYMLDVILEDGTKVKLNANSSLRYPSTFLNGDRVVYLEGEAYFNVSKSDKPFIVKLENDIDVKVYGTEFNINANNGDNIETVLVSGSVGVSVDNKEVLLKPSELININKSNNEYNVQLVDVNKYLGWKLGYFICDNEPVQNLVRDISKWYGVNFNFDENIDLQKIVIMNLDRYENINELLEILEMALKIRFIKESKDLYYVEPNKK